jgi:hypothetical protein
MSRAWIEIHGGCRWHLRCGETAVHLVGHPTLGLVETCGECVERFNLERDIVADVSHSDVVSVIAIEPARFAQYLEVRDAR